MAPIYLGKRVEPSSLRYIENLALPMLLFGMVNTENLTSVSYCSAFMVRILSSPLFPSTHTANSHGKLFKPIGHWPQKQSIQHNTIQSLMLDCLQIWNMCWVYYAFTISLFWNVSLQEASFLIFKESIVITLKLKSVQNQLKFYWFLTSM